MVRHIDFIDMSDYNRMRGDVIDDFNDWCDENDLTERHAIRIQFVDDKLLLTCFDDFVANEDGSTYDQEIHAETVPQITPLPQSVRDFMLDTELDQALDALIREEEE